MAKPASPHVPLYAGTEMIGRALPTEGGWTVLTRDGTRLGSHQSLVEARAAILARMYRPNPPLPLTGQAAG